MTALWQRFFPFLLVIFVAFFISGCWSSSKTVHNSKTLGQEFIDLKRALDTGAISHQEYEEIREELVDSAGNR